MANIRVPSFLTKLDKEDKKEMMDQYKTWKGLSLVEYLKSHLQSELDQLILEDEKVTPNSEFQFEWSRAKRLGRREQLRSLIKDL